MAANNSTLKVIRVTEKELEQTSNSVADSTQVSSERPRNNSESRLDNLNFTTQTSLTVSEEKPRNNDVDTEVAEDSHPSKNETEGEKVAKKVYSCTSKTQSINEDPKGRTRKVRKGYEVYQVKRGKYSERVAISEKDYLPSEKVNDSKKVEPSKNPTSSREKKKYPNNRDVFKDYRKTHGSSPAAVQSYEDWDNEQPSINEKNNVDKVGESWDDEIANHSEKLSVNNEGTEKHFDRINSREDSSKAIFNGLEEGKGNQKNETKQNIESKANSYKSNATEESNITLEKEEGKSGSYHQSREEDTVVENRMEKNTAKENLPSHMNSEEKAVSSNKRGIGRGRRSKEPPSHIGKKGQSKQGKEGKNVIKPRFVSKQSKKDSQWVEKSDIGTENLNSLPQKTMNDKRYIEASKLDSNAKKDALRKVHFSNEQVENINNGGVAENNASENKNRTAGILVLPSPINEANEIDVVRKDDEVKLSKEDFEKKYSFSKLERPNSFDPSKPRGDAKFVKENKESLLSRKKDIRISSLDSEIWNRINAECRKLQKLLANDLRSLDDIEKTLELSTLLQDLYKELIVKHLEFSFKNDVEGSLWKNTFHNIITAFRTILNEQEPHPFLNEAFQFYWNFLQDGDDFLKDLLMLLQEECKFKLEEFVNNPLKIATCKKQQKLGIRSCHLILLNLGDLERYIADLQQDTCYTKANENYLKARALAAKNGKSYNQLAIVAVKNKKKLDAIYYYIRSLEASNPIESARERLTGIFHEIKRKADLTKMQSLQKSLSFAEAAKKAQVDDKEEDFKSDYSREDIWVFYRGGKCFKAKIAPNGKIHEFTDAYTTPLEDQSSTEKFSLKEVNKEFLIYYLYVHSKLYSRIGFESIMTVYEDAMQPFKVLLKNDKASSVKMINLIKYMAINIFAVNNLFQKQENNTSIIKDSPLDVAIIFGMDMSAKIAEHCCLLIEKNDLVALKQFLPSVHVWMKWMSGYLDLIQASSVCYMKDIWESYMKFLSTIRSFDVEKVEELKDGEPTGLFEDMFLLGFKPLMDMENLTMKVAEEQKEKAEDFMRAESLKEIVFMISESRKVPVVFNEESSSFEIVMPEVTFDSPTKDRNALLLEDSATFDEDVDSDVIIEDVTGDIDDRELQHLKELKVKKMELTAQFNDHEKRKQERDAIVESNASQVHIISENHPKFIVPDTNCFIDYLDDLVRIIESKDFNIILPLIVVNELDGLKKGRELKGHGNNVAYVQDRARLAIEMLEKRFSENDKQLKALTSAGNELETIAFRVEELSSDKGKNDDIILSCCLHYCQEATNKFASSDGQLTVQRNVVLLTDDRNLRLKAHSRHVPTLSMKMFLRMAHFA